MSATTQIQSRSDDGGSQRGGGSRESCGPRRYREISPDTTAPLQSTPC